MNQAIQHDHPYLERFHKSEGEIAASSASWTLPLRKAAISRFADSGFPGRKSEEWRYTNVKSWSAQAFGVTSPQQLEPGSLDHHFYDELSALRVVFVDGFYQPQHSNIENLPKGLQVLTLEEALEQESELLQEHFMQLRAVEENAFSELNSALFSQALVVLVEESAEIQEPLQVLYYASSESGSQMAMHRLLVVAKKSSKCILQESYASADSVESFSNSQAEFYLEEDAKVDRIKLQLECAQASHYASLRVHQKRGSLFSNHSVSLGGALVRDEIEVRLEGEESHCDLNGVYCVDDARHVDSHTLIQHIAPNCTSDELYKGVLADKSRAVFKGKIHVHQSAQKTDAKQSNSNLLLSDDAFATAMPNLEIYADDVRCTHGATVGQLDEEALFYLRSRGISKSQAHTLLTHAFLNDVVDRLPLSEVRTDMSERIGQYLERSQNE